MNYFSEFATINIPIVINGKTEIQTVPDMFIRFKVLDIVKNDPFAIYEYEVKDGDRIETIADQYYGDVKYAWIVMLSNDFKDFYNDLPLTEDLLVDYILKKYNLTYPQIFSTIHHYVDSEGFIVDVLQYQQNPTGITPISIFQHEHALNENKRRIKLVSKKYLQQIVNEFRDKMSSIQEQRENQKAQIVNGD